MTRLLQVSNELHAAGGGIGSVVSTLAVSLAERGVHTTVVGMHSSTIFRGFGLMPYENREGWEIKRLCSGMRWIAPRLRLHLERRLFLRAVQKMHRKHPFDMVLADDYEGWLPYGGLPGVPTLVRLNGSCLVYDKLLGRKGWPLMHERERRTLSKANGWIGVSDFFLRETCLALAPVRPATASVIPNPVDTKLFSPICDVVPVPGRIVFHNTLGPRKGLQDLMQALPSIVAQVPNVHLRVCGHCPDQLERQEELLRMVPDEHRSRVVFLGRVNADGALQRELAEAQVACTPSHLESFGLAPVEAMSMEKVAVCSDCGPTREIIDDGVTGLLCRAKDPQGLAGRLVTALTLSRDQAVQMGRLAREKVVRDFDVSVVRERYLKLLSPHL
jgi:glycosyltransferase involved in cell wall biosynthesis